MSSQDVLSQTMQLLAEVETNIEKKIEVVIARTPEKRAIEEGGNDEPHNKKTKLARTGFALFAKELKENHSDGKLDTRHKWAELTHEEKQEYKVRATELVQEPENLTQDIDDKEELGGRKNLLIDIPEVTFEKETNSIGAEENNTVCGHAGDGDLPTAVVELQESLADASAEADRVCEVTEYIQVNETNTQDLPQERSTQCELDLHPAHHVTETPAGTPATEEGKIVTGERE